MKELEETSVARIFRVNADDVKCKMYNINQIWTFNLIQTKITIN